MGFTAQKVTVSPDLSCGPKIDALVFKKSLKSPWADLANIRIGSTNIALSHVEGMLAGMLEVDHFWQPPLVNFTRRRGLSTQNGNFLYKDKIPAAFFIVSHAFSVLSSSQHFPHFLEHWR